MPDDSTLTLEGSALDLPTMQEHYADLLIRAGVNLQPGQSLTLHAELEHAPFARLVAATAYRVGARYVHMIWRDDPIFQARILHSDADYLDFVPEFDVARLRQQVDEGWAALHLVGSSYPGILDELNPGYVRRARLAVRRAAGFYQEATMAHRIPWCVAGVPTAAWAAQTFPDLSSAEAIESLWRTILHTVRADQTDPLAAWKLHDERLRAIAESLMQKGVRSIHFEDPTPAPDGNPFTNLVIGLTDAPVWVAASSATPDGVRFLPNIPTEETFTTPHNMQAEGWVRTTKPAFVFDCRVDNALFRFANGELVEFAADYGQDRLDDLFKIPGANRLGEVALVDVRSPVNQSGVIFHETLFDENCVCHIAFGKSYPVGIENGPAMMAEELIAAGANDSEVHVDFMIRSPTLRVTGICTDGSLLAIIRDGRFTDEILGLA